jgi:hypothetical protein
MFAQDYRELKLPGADAVAQRSFLFEQFIEELLTRGALGVECSNSKMRTS